MRLSIIIANYNYRNFVGAAIESALAVDWADKEVIVVDDASTDDSRSIIEGFKGKLAAYFRPKSFQLGAHIFGFEQCLGDVIIFLDADDLLEPNVMLEIAKVWRPGVSKVQYRMNLIDGAGTQLGTAIPQFPPENPPDKLRKTYLRTMAYTTPPGSGNAYSRAFVRTTFAMVAAPNKQLVEGSRSPGAAESTLRASDAPLVTLAPILGDVLTIRKPLARYRVHDANDGALRSLDVAKLRNRLHQDVEMARLFATASRQLGRSVAHDPLSRSFNHLQYRFASRLLERSAHPFIGDTVFGLGCRLIYATFTYSQLRLRERTLLLLWMVGCALTPSYYRRKLVLWRFAPRSRPTVVKTLLGALSSLRSTPLPDRTGTAAEQ
jgi:glycosyltransferase involved in cell wall biosynthesis